MQHDAWDAPFHVMLVAQHLEPELRWLVWKPWRRWGLKVASYLWGAAGEIYIYMRALKTSQDQQWFRNTQKANEMHMSWFMYQHEWENRKLRPAEPLSPVYFGPSNICS